MFKQISNFTTLLCLLCVCIFSNNVFSQNTVYIKGQRLFIKNTTKMYVNGSLHATAREVTIPDSNKKVILKSEILIGDGNNHTKGDTAASLLISGDLLCADSLLFPKGNKAKVVFYGANNSTIQLAQPFYIGALVIEKSISKEVKLETTNVEVYHEITLKNGIINLNKSTTKLNEAAKCSGENEFSYIYGDHFLTTKANFSAQFPDFGYKSNGNYAQEVYRYNNKPKVGDDGQSADLVYKVIRETEGVSDIDLKYWDRLLVDESDLAVYFSTDSLKWTKISNATIDKNTNQISISNFESFNTAWFALSNNTCKTLVNNEILQNKSLCTNEQSILSSKIVDVNNRYFWSNTTNSTTSRNIQLLVDFASNYSLKYIAPNGCENSVNKEVIMYAKPEAATKYNGVSERDYICKGTSITYLDNSTLGHL